MIFRFFFVIFHLLFFFFQSPRTRSPTMWMRRFFVFSRNTPTRTRKLCHILKITLDPGEETAHTLQQRDPVRDIIYRIIYDVWKGREEVREGYETSARLFREESQYYLKKHFRPRRFYFSRSQPLYVSLYFFHLRVFPVNIDRSGDTPRPRISILTECCFRLFHVRYSFLLLYYNKLVSLRYDRM